MSTKEDEDTRRVSTQTHVDEDLDTARNNKRFMRLALKQAYLATIENEVPVGCIITLDDRVIASAFNRTNAEKNATRHCEIVAMDRVLSLVDEDSGEKIYDASVFRRCKLYVTVEPCIMCAAALSIVNFGKIHFGCYNDRFGGCGSVLNLHRSDAIPSARHEGLEIVSGVLEDEAVRVLKEFYTRGNPNAPESKRKRKL